MDFVRAINAYELYRVKQAIDILHTESIVFGDLQLPNIIITNQQKPMLIDFDWCGSHATDRYPSSLNDSFSIRWHQGVARNGIMHMEHNVFMLKAMQPAHSIDLSC
jgi:aminoglycoside phosphotransferase